MFGPLPRLLARLSVILGLYAVYIYSRAGLTLSHYDAKAHLVVARRILDSLTPGWEQVGAVWLPLPHLLNMLPVQIDELYRSGGSAIAVSVLSHAVATASIAATVLLLTASTAGAVLAAGLYATNPDILYLQATPMTEPLLFGLTTLQVWLLTRWVMDGSIDRRPAGVGWIIVLACLTRYEAWPITACAIAASMYAWWRRGAPAKAIFVAHTRLGLYPIATIAWFTLFSRMTVGEWFVSGGFFVPDETLRSQPLAVYEKIAEGTIALAGARLMRAAEAATIVVLALALIRRERAPMMIPLALFGAAALPIAAYFAGHPFRIRYEVPLIVAAALAVGLAIGQLRGWAKPAALVLFLFVYLQRPPFDIRARMVAEAQLDRDASRGRAQVTACLRKQYNGGTIMASMGSLGHYMQELSWAGFGIRDFLHEGNGPIWDSAYTRGPAPFVEWVLLEEQAEGGDAVSQRHRLLPRLLRDFDRVCEGGHVALYHRKPDRARIASTP
jgi:hypothetical protein